jgi:flavin reductase (DIM6/NTAB) family NADH-FMN oxidoreductase RutF
MFYEPNADPAALPLSIDPFKSIVVPRPIGWVTSLSPEGIVNLAPFSFFNAIGDSPPCVAFAPQGSKPDRPIKDTLANVTATREFVCNLATYALREKMNLTSARLPAGVDEMRKAGLTAAPSRLVKPPRVAESPAQLECRLLQIIDLPTWDPTERQALVIGQVIGIHIDDGLFKDGRVDIVDARPIARLGYSLYATVDNSFRMPRPD